MLTPGAEYSDAAGNGGVPQHWPYLAGWTTTVTAPAIYNSIGKWATDFPATPDKILKALDKILGHSS